MEFDYLRLDCQSDNWLFIRDGGSVFSPLIQIFNGQESSLKLSTMVTTSSKLFLEMKTSYFQDAGLLQCITGFIASFSVGKQLVVHVGKISPK